MTQEEKAKAYDEAIERAKKWRNAPNADKIPTFANRVIDEIFPELKESGDERIRKAIVATIHLYYGEPLEDEAKEMIAWLEKQGTSYTKRDVDDAYVEGMAFAKYELKKQSEQKPTDEEMKELLQTEYEKGRADAIAEMQNPAWSEEDECYMSECIGAIATKDGWSFEEKRKTKYWLKSLKDRVQPQKQEWREEDEAHINGIIDYLLNYKLFVYEEDMNVANGVQKELDWLKSLQRIGE